MSDVASVLAQVPMPDEGQNAWLWLSFVMAIAIAWGGREALKFGREVLAMVIKERDDWKAIAQSATAELAANTTALGKTTDALEHLGTSVDHLTATVAENARRIEQLQSGRGA